MDVSGRKEKKKAKAKNKQFFSVAFSIRAPFFFFPFSFFMRCCCFAHLPPPLVRHAALSGVSGRNLVGGTSPGSLLQKSKFHFGRFFSPPPLPSGSERAAASQQGGVSGGLRRQFGRILRFSEGFSRYQSPPPTPQSSAESVGLAPITDDGFAAAG